MEKEWSRREDPSMNGTTDVTRILTELSGGSPRAADELFPLVYDELRRLASKSLRSERPDHTLQATALVHEAYLRLVGQENAQWRGRAHFLAVAAQIVRRILVDHARSSKRLRRGGDRAKVPLDNVVLISPQHDYDIVGLDAALTRLADQMPRQARVVEMRFFGGATHEEMAEALRVTTRTIERDWRFARAWLFRELGPAHA
jgi:RNA polymerase sigma factor (TIGR02999 family)